jgi:membrane protease YdiL (CAAX protease family)
MFTKARREDQGPAPVAPTWHTIVLVLILLMPLIQTLRSSQGAASKPPSALAFYISGEVFFVIVFAWLWLGLRLRRVSLQSLIGGRWSNWREVAVDFGLGLAFWVFWYIAETVLKVALGAAGITNGRASGMVFPQGAVQLAIWILCSITAGVFEEMICRGYLMRQFTAWTGSAAIALWLQAVVFGVAHGFYLGTRQVIMITASGLLIGIFAQSQKSLRPAMIFHSWADIFGAVIVRGLPFA